MLGALKVEAEAGVLVVVVVVVVGVEVMGGAASPTVCADIPFYFRRGVSIRE